MSDTFIGRQPIYDRNNNVYAYELLFRNSEQNFATINDPDLATTQLIVNAVTEFGLDQIVGEHLAFVNLTRNFLTGSFPLPGAESQLVLEVLEDIEIDDEVLQGIMDLKQCGYTIALDDFIFHPHLKPLVEIADIIKLDLMAFDNNELIRHVKELECYPLKLLAEKIETHEEYEQCRELGFSYFQGYFFSKPNVMKGHKTPANRLALLQLLAKVSDPNIDVAQIEQLIARDVTLSFRLLRYINSSEQAIDKKIDSIQHAIMLLGLGTVRSLAYLIIMSQIDNKPMELFSTALIRAHMCEQIALLIDKKADKAAYFTVGLFSILDAVMDQEMKDIIEQLPLCETISSALLKKDGNMGQALHCAISYEHSEWEKIEQSPFNKDVLLRIYIESLQSAKAFTDSLSKLEAT